MRKVQTLAQQLQTHHGHDPRRDRKHAPVHLLSGLTDPVFLPPPRDLEPQRRAPRAQRLRYPAQERGPEHGAPAAVDGEVEWEREGEAFGDVVDEEGEEDGEAEGGVGVVGCVGDEALWDLVQGDGGGGLEADGQEGVGGDVVVVLGWVGGVRGVRVV